VLELSGGSPKGIPRVNSRCIAATDDGVGSRVESDDAISIVDDVLDIILCTWGDQGKS
jgi:hypothetical protein